MDGEKKLFPLLRVLRHTYARITPPCTIIILYSSPQHCMLQIGRPIVTETAIISVLTTYNKMVKKEKNWSLLRVNLLLRTNIAIRIITRTLYLQHIIYCIICISILLCVLNNALQATRIGFAGICRPHKVF